MSDHKEKNIRNQTNHGECNKNEILTLSGLLYLIGTQRTSKLNIEELWSLKFGITVFRVLVSEQEFQYLLSVLKFRTIRAGRKGDTCLQNNNNDNESDMSLLVGQSKGVIMNMSISLNRSSVLSTSIYMNSSVT